MPGYRCTLLGHRNASLAEGCGDERLEEEASAFCPSNAPGHEQELQQRWIY